MRFPGAIPAVTTLFDAHDEVDAVALENNVSRLLDAGVDGIVGTGTMGEAGSLSATERRLVIETIAGAVGGRAGGPCRAQRLPLAENEQAALAAALRALVAGVAA